MAARRATQTRTPAVETPAPAPSRFARKEANTPLPGVARHGRTAAEYDKDLLDAVRESFSAKVPFGVQLSELVGPTKQGEAADAYVKRGQAKVRRHVEGVNAQDGVRYGVSFGLDGTELWFQVGTKIEGRGRKPKAATN